MSNWPSAFIKHPCTQYFIMNLKIQVRAAETLPWSMRPADIDNADVLSFTIKIFKDLLHSLKTYSLQIIELMKGGFKNCSLLKELNSLNL